MGKGLCFPLSFLTLWGLMWLNGACFGVRFQRLLLPHPTPRSGGGGDHSYLWAPRMNQVHLEAPPPGPRQAPALVPSSGYCWRFWGALSGPQEPVAPVLCLQNSSPLSRLLAGPFSRPQEAAGPR